MAQIPGLPVGSRRHHRDCLRRSCRHSHRRVDCSFPDCTRDTQVHHGRLDSRCFDRKEQHYQCMCHRHSSFPLGAGGAITKAGRDMATWILGQVVDPAAKDFAEIFQQFCTTWHSPSYAISTRALPSFTCASVRDAIDVAHRVKFWSTDTCFARFRSRIAQLAYRAISIHITFVFADTPHTFWLNALTHIVAGTTM